MATKRMTRKQQQEAAKALHTCRECTSSYDWHEKGADGRPFMCRCAYHKGGKFSKFLSDPQCEHFNRRMKNGKATEAE